MTLVGQQAGSMWEASPCAASAPSLLPGWTSQTHMLGSAVRPVTAVHLPSQTIEQQDGSITKDMHEIWLRCTP